MIYRFNDEVFKTREEVESAIEKFADENYDEMLDDCYPEAEICGHKYLPSIALKEVDPIAYRCGIGDYENWLWEDVEEIDEEEGDE